MSSANANAGSAAAVGGEPAEPPRQAQTLCQCACVQPATKYCEDCRNFSYLCDCCYDFCHTAAKNQSHTSVPIEEHLAHLEAERVLLLKPETQSIRQLLLKNNPSFKVPDYQRSYEWGKLQIEALIESIQTAANCCDGMCFAGMIVVAKNESDCKDHRSFDIVDGQQRATTFMLLLICYNHLLCEDIAEVRKRCPQDDDTEEKLKRLDGFAKGVLELLEPAGKGQLREARTRFKLQDRKSTAKSQSSAQTFEKVLRKAINGGPIPEEELRETNTVGLAIKFILAYIRSNFVDDGVRMRAMENPPGHVIDGKGAITLKKEDDDLHKFMHYVQNRTCVITTIVNYAAAAKVFQGLNRNRGMQVRDSDTLITSIFQSMKAPETGKPVLRSSGINPTNAQDAFAKARSIITEAAERALEKTTEDAGNLKRCFPAMFPQEDGHELENVDYRDVFGEFLWHLQTISMQGRRDGKHENPQGSLLEYFSFEGAGAKIATPNPDPLGTTTHTKRPYTKDETSNPIEFVTWIGGPDGDSSWVAAFKAMMDEEKAWEYLAKDTKLDGGKICRSFKRALRNLFLIPHAEWRAAAMCAMCVTRSLASQGEFKLWMGGIVTFLQKLECLALAQAFNENKWGKQTRMRTMKERRQRYGKLAKDITDGARVQKEKFKLGDIDVLTKNDPKDLKDLKKDLKDLLHGDIYAHYKGGQLALAVLAIAETDESAEWAAPRLHSVGNRDNRDLLVNYSEKTMKDNELQVEHIAPQKMSKSSDIQLQVWKKAGWFEPHSSQYCNHLEYWKDKLGNLTPWEGDMNRIGSNNSFAFKREFPPDAVDKEGKPVVGGYKESKYPLTKWLAKSACPSPLSKKAAAKEPAMTTPRIPEWTPEACQERDKDLLGALEQRWGFPNFLGEGFLKREMEQQQQPDSAATGAHKKAPVVGATNAKVAQAKAADEKKVVREDTADAKGKAEAEPKAAAAVTAQKKAAAENGDDDGSDGDDSDDNKCLVSKSPSGAASASGGAKRKAPSTPDPSSSMGDAAATKPKKPRVDTGKSASKKGSDKGKEHLGFGSRSSPHHDLDNDGNGSNGDDRNDDNPLPKRSASNELPAWLVEKIKGVTKQQILDAVRKNGNIPTTWDMLLVGLGLSSGKDPNIKKDPGGAAGKPAPTSPAQRRTKDPYRKPKDYLRELKKEGNIVDNIVDTNKIMWSKRWWISQGV
jgi:hypothetical protein